MTKIPEKTKKKISADPFYGSCSLYGQEGHVCHGRITLDHAIIFGGRQLQEPWAIVPVCAEGHGVDEFQGAGTVSKELRLWVALNRAPEGALGPISKAIDYGRELKRLNSKYGKYVQKVPTPAELAKQKAIPRDHDWYSVTEADKKRIEKIRIFNLHIGSQLSQTQTITQAIEDMYLSISNHLCENDMDLYKKLGFDK